MAWYHDDGWLTRGLGPYLSTIIITTLIAILLPVLLHLFIYRPRKSASLPTFLILGPSGSGKTALLTKFETGKPSQTHTSQTPSTISTTLPSSATPKSSRYRSPHDHESHSPTPLLLTDTPGHPKLRHHAFNAMTTNPTGIIFVVDAANLATGTAAVGGLSDTASYLHDTLLALQRQHSRGKSSKSREVAFLVAANKGDLFTALPAPLVRAALEGEIGKIRETRIRGLAGVERVGEGLGSGDGSVKEEEEEEALGGTAEGKFEFGVMKEWDVHVDVVDGSVMGEGESGDVEDWWDWIAAQL